MILKKKKVIIALSGGVDSSVSAYLLKQQGHDVIGIFMKIWHDSNSNTNEPCPWIEDSSYALEVAEQLNIPFHVIDLSKEYKKRIIDYMFKEYSNGTTPNPDILCNKEIKFDVFLNHALKLNADFVATGHYANKKLNSKNSYSLIEATDKTKDQSYFLCQLNQSQLEKITFPIGGLLKSEVREIAKKNNLVTADRKDSQGLCFVGKIKIPEFLSKKLKRNSGDIIEIDSEKSIYKKLKKTIHEKSKAFEYSPKEGKVIGQHYGAHFFTIGQRKGLNIGGKEQPLFVLKTDVKKNIIYVGMGEQHPGLYKKALKIKKESCHWLREDLKINIGEKKNFLIRTRYRQQLIPGRLIMGKEYLYIEFTKKVKSITPGQFATWYLKNELIGSAPIFE